MRLSFWVFLVLTMALLSAAYAQTPQQSGVRVCSTTTSGSISHEYCTFTPLVVQVQLPPVTVTPQITVQPAPMAAPPPPVKEKPIKE